MTSPGARQAVLLVLLAWGGGVAIDSTIRGGGDGRPLALPARLTVPTGTLHRRTAAADRRPLPAGVLLGQAADYRGGAGDWLKVRQLVLASRGRSVDLPLDDVNRALASAGADGRCVTDGPSSPPWGRWQQLTWLAGLQPRPAHQCLWVAGSPTAVAALTRALASPGAVPPPGEVSAARPASR
jgi:hypothetical protein